MSTISYFEVHSPVSTESLTHILSPSFVNEKYFETQESNSQNLDSASNVFGERKTQTEVQQTLQDVNNDDTEKNNQLIEENSPALSTFSEEAFHFQAESFSTSGQQEAARRYLDKSFVLFFLWIFNLSLIIYAYLLEDLFLDGMIPILSYYMNFPVCLEVFWTSHIRPLPWRHLDEVLNTIDTLSYFMLMIAISLKQLGYFPISSSGCFPLLISLIISVIYRRTIPQIFN